MHDVGEIKSSIFAQYAQGVGDFRFVLAGSYDRVDPTQRVMYRNAATAEQKWYRKYEDIGDYTLQGVLYYDFSQGNSLHLTVGKKQTWPSIETRYGSSTSGAYIINPDLKAESAINYEVGYDLKMKSSLGSTYISTAAYFNDMKNMLTTESIYYDTKEMAECTSPSGGPTNYNPNNPYRCTKRINMDYGYTYGGEIAAEQGFWDDKFVLGVNYSYIQKFAKGNSSDNRNAGHKITDYANHQLNGKVAFYPRKDLDIVALWTYHSAPWYQTYTRWRDENNAWVYNYYYVRGRAYITVDLSVNYEIGKGLSVNVAAYNLVDRLNWLGSGTSYYVQPGRRFVVGLDYKY